MSQRSALDVENNMYTNEYLDKSELRKVNSLEIHVINVDIGYTDGNELPNGCGCSYKFEINDTVREKPLVVISHGSLKTDISQNLLT